MNELKNTETLVYCLNKSFVETEYNLRMLKDEDNKEAYYYVSDTVHRIIDCYDRIPGERYDSTEKIIVSGLRFVNNCLKHNPSLEFVHWCEEKATTLPILMDEKTSSFCHRWCDLDYVILDEKFQSQSKTQRENYNKYWKNKVVLYTFRYFVYQINKKHMVLSEIPFMDTHILKYTLNKEWEGIFTKAKFDNENSSINI